MKEIEFIIKDNQEIAPRVFRMEALGDVSDITSPGQFVEISIPGFYLRRPISVCDASEGKLTLIYKCVGGGTERMSTMRPGERLSMLSGLGHGFSIGTHSAPVLIGGGVGIPPLYLLAKEWLKRGVSPKVILGFNREDEIFLLKEFVELGVDINISTVDGSRGTRGFVTDALKESGWTPDFFQACGPLPMLKALTETFPELDGEISLEERMGCGFGACMGCTIHTMAGNARVCKDGPVFNRSLIDWELL